MLTYKLIQKNQELLVAFSGAVSEKAPLVLNELLTRLNATKVLLDMEGVEYFNSLGIRAWAHFVKSLVEGRTVSYANCPPDFINQVNMMPLLTDSIEILSFSSEFVCPDCHHSQRDSFDATKSKAQLLIEFEKATCSHCGSGLLPDEDPETILYFKNTKI